MSEAKITITYDTGFKACRRFQLRAETWAKQEKRATLNFLKENIKNGHTPIP